jgi:AcrR family transcriptional regulator
MHKIIEKSELVQIAADLFRMQGYAATSIDDIAKACGLSKGSLYHHFTGKQDLALAALEQVHQHYRDHIFTIIAAHEQPAIAQLAAFNAAVEAFFARHPHGCLLANLSLEGAEDGGPFHRHITRFFDDWIACYARVFAQYFPPATASARAEDALAAVQGCLLMNRIRPGPHPLQRLHAGMLDSCKAGAHQ